MTRENKLRSILMAAYRAHGIVDPAILESHLAGTDFTHPVEAVTLPAGETFVVYVRDGGVPGKHAAPVESRPSSLGIVMDGRHCQRFVLEKPLLVVRCTAADFETGRIPTIGGRGGGVQYVLPPDWLESVRRM